MNKIIAAVAGAALLAGIPAATASEPGVSRGVVVQSVAEECCNDAIVCPYLIQIGQIAGGGIPGVIEINSHGDVQFYNVPVKDCPPYEV